MAHEPTKSGYALPAMNPTVSEVAPIIRLAAINGSLGTHELRYRPQSVLDQRDLPCCISCALSFAMESIQANVPPLSPLFHYYVTRFDKGGADADGFLYLDDGLDTLTNEGISRRGLHSVPFTSAGITIRPTTEAYADALTRALGLRGLFPRYTQLDGPSKVAAIRDEIAQDHPVVVGIQLPKGYPKAFLNSQFEWLDPDNPERSLAGHCVLVVGYNDAKSCLHIQDSRGSSLFDKGLWWMGYRVVDSSIVQDAYSLSP
jgi:hypothetical protein